VISADSMQVYIGNDISSATVTEEEMMGVPHHLVSVISPDRQLALEEFRAMAMRSISATQSRRTLPIVAGGTIAWVEALLFPGLLEPSSPSGPTLTAGAVGIGNGKKEAKGATEATEATATEAKEATEAEEATEAAEAAETPSATADAKADVAVPADLTQLEKGELYALLLRADPLMANKLHANDTRKVRRALQVFRDTGRPLSAELMRKKEKGAYSSTPFDVCVFWLSCDNEVLRQRLDSRIDRMVEQGLKQEVERLCETLISSSGQGAKGAESKNRGSAEGSSAKLERIFKEPIGLVQSIGFRQFERYLKSKYSGCLSRMDASQIDAKRNEELFRSGLETLKVATRRYAKRQIRWIKTRMLPFSQLQRPLFEMHQLDTTTKEKWQTDVLPKALAILRRFLAKKEHFQEDIKDRNADAQYSVGIVSSIGSWKKYRCEECNRTLNGKNEYEVHLKSRGHKKRRAKRRKRQRQQNRAETVRASRKAARILNAEGCKELNDDKGRSNG